MNIDLLAQMSRTSAAEDDTIINKFTSQSSLTPQFNELMAANQMISEQREYDSLPPSDSLYQDYFPLNHNVTPQLDTGGVLPTRQVVPRPGMRPSLKSNLRSKIGRGSSRSPHKLSTSSQELGFGNSAEVISYISESMVPVQTRTLEARILRNEIYISQ